LAVSVSKFIGSEKGVHELDPHNLDRQEREQPFPRESANKFENQRVFELWGATTTPAEPSAVKAFHSTYAAFQ
jgi:hypothetical protein